MISTKALKKTVELPSKEQLIILDNINLDIPQGSIASIIGRSGSGKTTLLGLLAGLDTCSSGEIWLNEQPLHSYSEAQRTQVRAEDVGFIFQNFQLLPSLTTLDNVMLAMELTGISNAYEKAIQALEKVGLLHRLKHYPKLLSGGEQQRVAIARAIAHQPHVLFADEPTGNLDHKNSDKILQLLWDLQRDIHTTLVIVTHDLKLAEQTQQQFHLDDGRLLH